MGAPENRVESHLKNEVKRLGGRSYKWVSPGCTGVPDQIVMLFGEVWFVEVKTLCGTFSPQQLRRATEIKQQGMNIHPVYGKRGVDKFIKKLQLNNAKETLRQKVGK